MIKKFSLLLLCLIAAITVKGQDSPIRPLLGNAQIIEYRKHLPKENTHSNARTQSTTTSLLLPFYDEFSYAGPYPDPTKWQNSQSVYVNRTKAIAPPTLGVATFDGLNKYGYPYLDNQTINCSNAGNSNVYVASDTLTSLPIRLDSSGTNGFSYSPIDSMYLSFYYQPMGYYEAPETGDVLYLDFYSPLDTTWNTVWSRGGYTPTDSAWHLVMVPITDTSYFHKNFQFRFRNISAGGGDVDHWHLDVISLKPSAYNDTIFPDKSFVYDLPSTLKNYTQMPYNQYAGGADMKTHIGVCLRNNDNSNSGQSVSTEYSSIDNTHNTYISPLHQLASTNLSYYYNGGYCTADSVVKPSLNFVYPSSMTDTISYSMKFSLHHNTDPHPGNDTISFTQKFDRYYSYDDGSAEVGYSICGEPVAVKYKLNVADSLRAMDIFFDPILDVKFLESTSFKIAVWGDNGGLPSNTPLYTDSLDRYPYFPADTVIPGTQRINSFLRYQFLHPVHLAAGSVFYIGVIPNSNTTLSIGLDRNNTFYQNMFRYVASNINQWFVFAGAVIPDWDGALMLHPVFGSYAQTLSIKDYASTNKANFTLYPNPASDEVTIKSADNITQVVVTDVLGNLILQQTSSAIKTINTLSLQSGVYLIKAFNDKGFADTQKLIIAR